MRNLLLRKTNINDVWGKMLAEEHLKRMHRSSQSLHRFSSWLLIATCATAGFAISNFETLAEVLPRDSFPLSLLKYSIATGFAAKCFVSFSEFVFTTAQPMGCDRLETISSIEKALENGFSAEDASTLDLDSVEAAARKHAITRLPFLFRLLFRRPPSDDSEEKLDIDRHRTAIFTDFVAVVLTVFQCALFVGAIGVALDYVETEINRVIEKTEEASSDQSLDSESAPQGRAGAGFER